MNDTSEEFVEGEAVRLKTGGPEMTVEQRLSDPGKRWPSGGYKVVWFVDGLVQRDLFPGAALMKSAVAGLPKDEGA